MIYKNNVSQHGFKREKPIKLKQLDNFYKEHHNNRSMQSLTTSSARQKLAAKVVKTELNYKSFR